MDCPKTGGWRKIKKINCKILEPLEMLPLVTRGQILTALRHKDTK